MPSILRKSFSKTIKDDDSITSSSSSSRKLFRRKSLTEKNGRKNKLNSSVKVSTRASTKAATPGSVKKVADKRISSKEGKVNPEKPTESREEVKKVEVAADDASAEETVELSKAPSFDDSASEGSKGSDRIIDPANVRSVVLLLMDTATRRFELTRVEFDAKRDTVADVVSQIAQSAGEDIKKNMKYNGICKSDGTEPGSACDVSEFLSENGMFIAIPEGFDGKKIADQASSILADPKVIDMLQSKGVSVSALREVKDITDRIHDATCELNLDGQLQRTDVSLSVPQEAEGQSTAISRSVLQKREEETDATRDATGESNPEEEAIPTAISLPEVQESKDGTDDTQDAASKSNVDEKSEKSVTPAPPKATTLLNDIGATIKPKLEEVQQFLKNVVGHIEKLPTMYQFVLIGFLFVALCFLVYAVAAGGTAPVSSVDVIAEPIEIEVTEDIIVPEKKKLFKAVSKTILKFRRGKGVDVES